MSTTEQKTIFSKAHKAALSEAHKGKKQSEETKQKIRETLKATFARRKKKLNPNPISQ